MKIKIYQVAPHASEALFRSYYTITTRGKGVLPENYHCVFEGEVEGAKSLEDVFMTFNFCVNEYPNFKGHSLSVSDIVERLDDNPKYAGCHFCDAVGFVKLKEFDTSSIPNIATA